jgi:uncharacterized membrane protein YcaP (DUF421 family)
LVIAHVIRTPFLHRHWFSLRLGSARCVTTHEHDVSRTLVFQAAWAAVYYLGVVAIVRIAGKRLAGQTGTFDLVVLIQLATVLQRMDDSPAEGFTFLATVMACHLGLARLSAGSLVVRRILRGEPCALVRDGQILQEALESEGMSRDDLLAGLRKQGYASPEDVKLAVLEETGHLSAVPRDDPGHVRR